MIKHYNNMFRWLQNAWFGGCASDQFLGIPNSFQSSKNVEVRQQPKMITLARRPVRSSSGVVVDWVMKWITIQSTGDVIGFGDTGRIYRQAAGSGNFVLVYTDTSNRKIINAYEYNNYLYWATSGHLHRIAVANIDASWSGDVTQDYRTFTTGNSSHHPMLEVYNKLYIGDGPNLAELDSLGTFTGSKIPIFGDEAIVGITFNGSLVRIYSQRTTTVDYGRCYFWSGLSSNYNEFVTWQGKTIHAVIHNNRDYVIAGRKPSLYAVAEYEPQHLTQLPDFADGDSATFNENCMAILGNVLLFGAVESGTNSLNRGVWSFGAKNKEFPEVLSNDYTTSNASTTDLVAAVHVSGGKVYSSWKNGSTYGVDITDNTLYAATGEVVSRVNDGGNGTDIKEIQNLKLAFKQLAAGEKIELFLRRGLTSSWGSAIITVDYDNDVADRTVNFKELGTNEVGGPYNFLETKVVLTAGTSGLTTPTVTDILVNSEVIQSQ